MKTPNDQLKTLLRLPSNARADDVYECVIGCLTDALDCQLQKPLRLPGKTPLYQAIWLTPDGSRYVGEGRSGRSATLAGAVQLISEAQEAQLIRSHLDPDHFKRTEALTPEPAPPRPPPRRAGLSE